MFHFIFRVFHSSNDILTFIVRNVFRRDVDGEPGSGVARGGARGAIAPHFFLEKRNAKCNNIKSSYENNTPTTQRLRGPRAVLLVFLL